MTVIVGPCPCHRCGVRLWWCRVDGILAWVELHRHGAHPYVWHRCARRAAA